MHKEEDSVLLAIHNIYRLDKSMHFKERIKFWPEVSKEIYRQKQNKNSASKTREIF